MTGDQNFRCHACGATSTTTQPVHATPQHCYRLCTDCGTGQLTPMPQDPESFYTRGYFVEGGDLAGYLDYEADARWHRITARQRLARLDRALRAGTAPAASRPGSDPAVGVGVADGTTAGAGQQRRLVDVGAATGFLLDVARDQGWQASGVEASQWAADRARAKGHPVAARLSQCTGPVEAVSYFQVLEHVPDPVASLRTAAGLLAPGGVVICETWDARSLTARLAGSRWQQLSPPSVLWLFTRQGMSRMASQAGLELVSWKASPKLVGLSTVLGQSVAATNHGRAARVLRAAGQLLAVPYPLDDLVTVALRKR